MIEFGVPKVGTAYEDAALDKMYETYDSEKSCYFVVTKDQEILGGAGIMKLQNSEENICELQKMYMNPKARGKKIGKKLILKCLDFAKKMVLNNVI